MRDATISETAALFGDLDKPSLVALSYALRHPETWPKGFHWNYRRCDDCAMGLAHRLWSGIAWDFNADNGASVMAREFAIPYSEAEAIFYGAGQRRLRMEKLMFGLVPRKRPLPMSEVTPEMVADDIDAYLVRAE